MSYDEDEAPPRPIDHDPRVAAMHRFVELEEKHKHIQREALRMEKKAAEVGGMVRAARDELGNLLGYPHSGGEAQAMDSAEVRKIIEERYR